MPNVSVIIPTQRRPAPLLLALTSVLAQRGIDRDDVEIVVVDNDAVPSAQAAILEQAALSDIPIHYVHEPRAGVVYARNAALARAQGRFIAFLDDDEEAPASWLATLIQTQAHHRADVVFGPVHARVPADIRHHRAYLTRFFSRLDPASEGPIPHYYGCGNSLLRRAALPDPVAPFDLSRNFIGGEDDMLFGRMQAAGARFAWSPDAWVYEDPASSRLTLRYTLRRAFAYGQGPTSHCAAAVPPDRVGVARWMVIGVGQAVVYGAMGALKWIARAPDTAETWDRAARGLGKTFWGGPLKITFYGTSS